MITFATEPWPQIKNEVWSLWQKHHDEISDPEAYAKVPLSPDIPKYEACADSGALHITAGRQNGKLVAYAFVFVERGLHNSTTLFGHWDLYWVSPESRGHWTGIRLFKEVERAMKARGVQKMTNRRKLWHDTGPIFKRLGWKDIEIASTKWIGD